MKFTKERFEGINKRSFFRAQEIKKKICTTLKVSSTNNQHEDKDNIVKALLSGLIEGLYIHSHDKYYTNEKMDKRQLDKSSCIQGEWLIGIPKDIEFTNRNGLRQTINLLSLATVVDPLVVADMFPHLVTKSEGENPKYNYEEDTPYSTTKVYLNGECINKFIVNTANPNSATRELANFLTDEIAYDKNTITEDKGKIYEIIQYNKDVYKKRMKLSEKTEDIEISHFSTREFIVAKLKGATKLSEIQNLEELRLPPIDKDFYEELNKKRPDKINVLGETLDVYYLKDCTVTAKIWLSQKLIKELPNDYKFGIDEKLNIIFGCNENYMNAYSLEELKIKIKLKEEREVYEKQLIETKKMYESKKFNFEEQKIEEVTKEIFIHKTKAYVAIKNTYRENFETVITENKERAEQYTKESMIRYAVEKLEKAYLLGEKQEKLIDKIYEIENTTEKLNETIQEMMTCKC